MSTAVSIRLSDEIAYELGGLTRITESFRIYTIHEAVESYLQEYADYSVATEHLNDKDAGIISSNEMGNRLAL